MSYNVTARKQDVSAVDIQTMESMSSQDYDEYIRNYLVYVDHHDILRSMAAGYPLAVTKSQAQALMAYLGELIPTVGER
jgi:hypothetical protein